MAVFEIQAPDGKTYRIEGANQEGALAALKQHLGGGQSGQLNSAHSAETVGADPSSQDTVPRNGQHAQQIPPWERHQTPPQNAEGPWTRYSGWSAPAAQGAATAAGVTQQQMGNLSPEQQAFVNDIYAGPEFEAAPHVPLGQVVKENIVGDNDDTTFNTGEKIGQMLNNAGESLTFGVVGDEAHAAVASALGGDYDASLESQRQQQAQFRENHPVASFASDVAPAAIPGMGAAKALRGATRLGRAGHGALVGAGSGLTYGAMEGEGSLQDRTQNAVVTGALGGIFGAAAPKVMDALGDAPRRVQALFTRSSQRPTLEALRTTKNAAYKAVDQAGVSFSADDMTRLSQNVQRVFSESNFDEVADTASGAVLRILRGKEGREQTLGQLDRVRQNLWKRYAHASDQPQILDAITEIDNLIDAHPDASGLMNIARTANATYAKSQLLEDAFDRAARQTSISGSGGNVANNYMRAVNVILNNNRQLRFFNADELQAMRAFVSMADEGGPRIRRLIGKMSPSGNGLMMTLHAVGGMASGGATLPLMVAGGVAKNSADKAVLRGGEALQDAFAGVAPLSRPRNALSPATGAIVSGATPVLERGQSNLLLAGNQSRRQTR